MINTHLHEVQMSYLGHLAHAWRLSLVLIVHGLIPWIWTHKVSDEICGSGTS
jgi:hypothetical protein